METSNAVGFALLSLALATAALDGCSGEVTGQGSGGASTSGGAGGASATGGGSMTGGSSAAGRGGTAGSGGASTGGSAGAGTGGGTGAGGAGGAIDAGAPAGDAGPLDGLNIDGKCFPLCASAATDPDGDGYGYENQQSCIVPGSPPSRGRAPCATGIVRPTGDGIQAGGVCYPLCSTDPNVTQNVDPQGYGYDVLFQTTCVVPNSVAALMGTPCHTGLTRPPIPTPGTGFFVGGVCYPRCANPAADTDGDGWSFEDAVCIVAGSKPAMSALSCAPMQTPPPPPPPGTGWNADYTATMFGQVNCAPLGFTDSTDINQSACVSRQAVTLTNDTNGNRTYFGAPGDLSTLWTGAQCTCPGGQATCVPACNGQQDCAMCVEIACNAAGTHSFMNTGDTHNRFCRAGQSVVVQIIDACPHNHVNNTYWCTSARPNHIDLSCSAFQQITQGAAVGTIGYVNAYVRPVPCSVGLGPKTF